MGKYLVITIDVEPDCTPTWVYSNPLAFNGVTTGIAEILQPLFNRYNAYPTYLINNVVLEDKASVETFLKLKGNFELGTHLHAEFIDPEKRFFDYAGRKGEENQCYLDPVIEHEKMAKITELFISAFDKRPTSFRAGRFSASSNTIGSLKKLGYKVDTSVTPHVKWYDRTRPVPIDFSKASEQPYFIKEGSILEKGISGNILEVPVSIVNSKGLFGSRTKWLRPHFSNLSDFKKIVKKLDDKYTESEHLVFNMMFHNVEVMPLLSPYTSTERDCKEYLGSIEGFLSYCKDNKVEFVGLSDLYEIFSK